MAEGSAPVTADTPAENNPFIEWTERYAQRPDLFVREVLGAEPDDWQTEVMLAVASGERRVSIRSGHGVGKTACLSWLIIWFILTRYPAKVVCTAPTAAQLFDALAAEVKGWCNRLPPAIQGLLTVKAEHIVLTADPNMSFVAFRTSRPETPEALAGVHSGNVLLIADEASGVHEAVFETAAGSMSGHAACTVLAGNPVRTTGFFFDTHHRLRDKWRTFHVSCERSRRVSKDFIEEMADRYGADSNAYRVRVLGEFPKSDDDTIIPFELMEASLLRDVEAGNMLPVWGLDCARFGADRSALAKRKGNVLTEPVIKWAGKDTMQVAGAVKLEWDATPLTERPAVICVDVIGIGSGVCDRLREMGLPVRGINVSESPALKDRFVNLKAELWWAAREWFSERNGHLCGDGELGAELVDVRYRFTSAGKIQVESKAEIKKRGKRSPDCADAFVLTFAEPATVASGASLVSRWDTALDWRIPGLV